MQKRKECAAMDNGATVKHETYANVIKVSGDFCFETVQMVRPVVEELFKLDRKGIIFDLSEVEFIDSKGAGFLLDVKRCLRNGRRVMLAAIPPQILAVLSRLMIAEQFKMCKTVEEALIKIRN
ncbi:MAG: STAS domain-containing protein [bacterium]